MIPVEEIEERWSPEALSYFREHKRLWEAGEIRLEDFAVEHMYDRQGHIVPRWYPGELGEKVVYPKDWLYEKLGYRPNLPACRFHASLAKIKFFSGGAGAGKSKAGSMEMLPILLTPGSMYRDNLTLIWLVAPEYKIASPEFDYLIEAVKHPFWNGALEKLIKRGGKLQNNPGQGDMVLEIRWPDGSVSRAEVRSGRRPESLLSVSLQGLVMCEGALFPEEHFNNKLRMRVARGGGTILFPTTPSGLGWTADLYKKGLAGEDGYFSTNSDTRLNPTIDLEEVRFYSQDMSDEDFDEQVRGRPTSRFGTVYPEFDRAIHVDTWDPDWPNPTWQVARSIDFGYTDPFVVLWVAFDEDWRAYVFHEFYQRKRIVPDVVRYIADYEGLDLREVGDDRFPQVRSISRRRVNVSLPTIADWDASGRAELLRSGIRPIRKADKFGAKTLMDGIRKVKAELRVQPDGLPRILINPACRNLINEFVGYEWDKKAETPKAQQADHALDALRYLIYTLSRDRASPRIRSIRFGG